MTAVILTVEGRRRSIQAKIVLQFIEVVTEYDVQLECRIYYDGHSLVVILWSESKSHIKFYTEGRAYVLDIGWNQTEESLTCQCCGWEQVKNGFGRLSK
jgi:hypothetical protein